MQVTVEDQSPVKKILHIEVPEEKVTKELDSAYKDLKKKAKIKGFRPGKAPRSVLERMYKKDVHADVISRIIQESFMDALKQTELNILGSPKVDPPELVAKSNYKYDATVEVKPEIEDVDYKGLSLSKTIYKVNDEEVKAQIQMLQKNLAQISPIEEERPVKEDDFVIIDYEGFKDGEPFEELQKTENHTVKIGIGSILKEFDDNLIGMNRGEEKEFDVTFPEDYHNKKLAENKITFKVSLKEIKQEELPEVDDEFAKKLGPFKTLDDLKKEIVNNLTQGYDKRIEQELNEQIFEALIAQSSFEVPEIMVEYELESIIAEAERSFAASNITMEQVGLTKETMAEKYRDTAEKQSRRHLILDKVINQESLTISDDDKEEGFNDMAKNFNQPINVIKDFYEQNPDKLELFEHALLEKKAISLILENSDIEEKEPELEQTDEKEAEEKS